MRKGQKGKELGSKMPKGGSVLEKDVPWCDDNEVLKM